MKPSKVAKASLLLAGWKYEGDVPSVKKAVCLAVPHTSNWDGLLLVALLRSIGLEMEWMLKSSWMRGPLGPVMRKVGAVGIDRSQPHHVVDAMIAEFDKRDRFLLGIPPEGSRSRRPFWKSGFYRIALGAGVPVIPGYLDYGRKRAGLGPPITMTGNVRADMDKIRAYYAEVAPTPHVPSKFGPIVLREEGEHS